MSRECVNVKDAAAKLATVLGHGRLAGGREAVAHLSLRESARRVGEVYRQVVER